MILIDTSIWADHLGFPDPRMSALLAEQRVTLHPMVFGELVLGSLPRRARTIGDLRRLPAPIVARTEEVVGAIEANDLSQSGIGLVDAHLVVSCLLDARLTLWTRDKPLLRVAERLGVAAAIRAH